MWSMSTPFLDILNNNAGRVGTAGDCRGLPGSTAAAPDPPLPQGPGALLLGAIGVQGTPLYICVAGAASYGLIGKRMRPHVHAYAQAPASRGQLQA